MDFSFKKLRKLIFFAFVLLFVIGLLPNLGHASDEFGYKIDIKYDINDQSNTHVTENYQVTNNTPRQYLTELKVAMPTDVVNNLKVSYSDGASIPFTTEKKANDSEGYQYEYLQANIVFNRQNAGNGLAWNFNLSYDTTKLVDNKGTSHTAYIPAIAPSEKAEDYNITVLAPLNFGNPHPSSVKPEESSKQGNKQVFQFNPRELINNPISIVFGDSTTYDINFNFPLNNQSDSEKNFSVTLPPDMPNQKIFINSLDPKPISTHLDEDSNVIADYRVAARTNVVVKTDISALVKYLDYDLSASGNKNDLPDNLVQKYTKPARYWQSNNPDILVKAKSLSNGNFNVSKAIKDTDKFVVDELSYNNEKIKYNIRQGAVQALKDPNNAVCLEYSDLMIALLRAQGIPARMPIGYAYSSNLKASDSVADSLHSWVQAYVPNVGWINVDPTWDEKFNGFGKSDMDHFAFALWGKSDDSPVAVTMNGADQNYQYEDAKIKYLDKSPTPSLNTDLSARKFVILPFISVATFSISAPSAISSDDNKLQLTSGPDKKIVDLGSLAPAQKISSFALMFGSGFASPLSSEYHQGSLVLASSETKAIYWPLVILVVAISGFATYKLIKLVSSRRKKIALSNGQKE
jgi:hypothetical protein